MTPSKDAPQHGLQLPSALLKLMDKLGSLWIPADLSPQDADVLKYFITGPQRLQQYKDQFTIIGKATRSGSLYALFQPDGTPWPQFMTCAGAWR
jgi:hypothetical protein